MSPAAADTRSPQPAGATFHTGWLTRNTAIAPRTAPTDAPIVTPRPTVTAPAVGPARHCSGMARVPAATHSTRKAITTIANPGAASDATRPTATIAAAVTAAAAVSSPSRPKSVRRVPPRPRGRRMPPFSDGAMHRTRALASRMAATPTSSGSAADVRIAASVTANAANVAPATVSGAWRRRATWLTAVALSTAATVTKVAARIAVTLTVPGGARAAVAAAMAPGRANAAAPQPASAARSSKTPVQTTPSARSHGLVRSQVVSGLTATVSSPTPMTSTKPPEPTGSRTTVSTSAGSPPVLGCGATGWRADVSTLA